MNTWRKAVLLVSGLLVVMFVVAAGWAWAYTGFIDVRTVTAMGITLMPLLACAIGILVWVDARDRRRLRASLKEKQAFAKRDEALGPVKP